MEPTPLDDALTMFAATAPEFGAVGLSNHGPMASEVLERLGRPEAIAGWAAAYRGRLAEAPAPASRPLGEEQWPAALGQGDRFPEWLATFEIELADRPAPAVVGEWGPRLAPGAVGAATHGLIRTAHALRGLQAAETGPRRLEVAQGLAYWASRYQELPGPPLLIGSQGVDDALAQLPYLPEETPQEFLISAQVAHVADVSDEFEQAVASLGFGGSALELLDALAVGGAGPICATLTGVTPSPCSMPLPVRWRSSSSCPGWPLRTATQPWPTPGKPWRPFMWPTPSTVTRLTSMANLRPVTS